MNKLSIKARLSSACCCLLGSTAYAENQPWLIDMGVMNYIEQDRNTGVEFLINGTRSLEGGDAISLQVDFDVITGATPNGATASNVSQTFTMASGIGRYTVNKNTLPADDTHMDIRMAFSAGYLDKVNESLTINYASHISMEFDYLSLGGGIEFLYDFNQHTTTLIAGFDAEYNRVHPVGGLPIGFASMQAPGALQPKGSASETRRQSGIHVGLNQILNKTSLIQLKYSQANASGYLTDPYKILSIIDDVNISQLGATTDYIYEKRPNQREINSIYSAYKKSIDGDILDLSYRYYWDEWDINSHTVDVKYRYEMSNHFYLQPHARVYSQTAASFFRHSLTSSETPPSYASSDFRLAEFNAYTLGFRFGKRMGEFGENSIGLEYYTQIGDSHPDTAVGLQNDQDLFPTLKTLLITWNYSYTW